MNQEDAAKELMWLWNHMGIEYSLLLNFAKLQFQLEEYLIDI